ncbi:MAG: DUF4424 family protein [Fimbriimonadaceae bacterium]
MTSFVAVALMLNDTSFSARSGNPKPMSGVTPVEMTSADIKVKIPSCEVTVTYSFKNTSGKSETAIMGFPEEGYDAYLDKKNKTWFKSFKSWVDGKSTPVLVQKIDDPSNDPDFGYSVWWVKSIDFKAGQVRSVKNVYMSQPGGDTMPRQFFEYIVHTAKSWRGPIGKIRLELDASGLEKGTRYATKAKPHKVDGDQLAWFWTNLEPDETNDLWVAWERKEYNYESADMAKVLGGFVRVASGK